MRHDRAFYWSGEWRRARAAYLASRPVCELPGCGNRPTHVDHRTARAAGGASLDAANLRALCSGCHSAKTATSDGGFGNRRGRAAPTGAKGCDAEGNPADPRHAWNAARGQGQ